MGQLTIDVLVLAVTAYRNLFQMLDTEDKGYIKFEEYLIGIAILNEQVFRLLSESFSGISVASSHHRFMGAETTGLRVGIWMRPLVW